MNILGSFPSCNGFVKKITEIRPQTFQQRSALSTTASHCEHASGVQTCSNMTCSKQTKPQKKHGAKQVAHPSLRTSPLVERAACKLWPTTQQHLCLAFPARAIPMPRYPDGPDGWPLFSHPNSIAQCHRTSVSRGSLFKADLLF